MKRFSGAAATAILVAATGAHAQGGPTNHSVQAVRAPPAPVAAAIAPPPPTIDAMLDHTRATLQSDLDQHKIGHRKAAHIKRELQAIQHEVMQLQNRVAKIDHTLP